MNTEVCMLIWESGYYQWVMNTEVCVLIWERGVLPVGHEYRNVYVVDLGEEGITTINCV